MQNISLAAAAALALVSCTGSDATEADETEEVGSVEPAASQAYPDPQMFEDASLIDFAIATEDPCVVGGLQVEVHDFVAPNDAVFYDTVYYNAFSVNVCTGEWLHAVQAIGDQYQAIDESDFEYSQGHDAGDLIVTLPAFDWMTMTETSIALNLRWRSTRAVSDSSFTVAGTVTTAGFEIVLDDSITWNRWGSELGASWAGMWPCRFGSTGTPGCLGQTWPPPRRDPR